MKLVWKVFDRNFASNTSIFDGKKKQVSFDHEFKVLIAMNQTEFHYGSKITHFELIDANDCSINYGMFEFDIGTFANQLQDEQSIE